MKTLTIAFLLLSSIYTQLHAQDIEGWVNSKKPLLFEKLYVHVDRELYAPGDKVWLKVYQVNGITHQLNSNFRNIFVQMVAEDGLVVKDLLLFSIKGQANGEFNTDSVASGMYTIRAFTKYLEIFGEEACFHKKIWITKSLNSVDIGTKALTDPSKIDVAFLPEGGNMVLNTVNTVAFKAINQNGRGIEVTGKIIDELGESVVTFKSTYMGLGKLIMMPVDGKSYYAVIDQNPGLKITLPTAIAEGFCINYKDNGESLRFTMSANMNLNEHPPFYFVASHKGIVLFYKKIEMTDFTHTMNLSKYLFPKGISKISLLDTTFKEFAQRLIFVDDGKPELVKLQLNKQEFKPREEVNIGFETLLAPDDSINTPLSVAVVNKSYFGGGENSQTIKSYLLLDAELKGAIELPALYFVDDIALKSGDKLDLLMMVHGWSSYVWDDVAKVQTPSADSWNDAGIEIKGFVKKLMWKGPQPDAALTLSSAGGKFTIDKTVSNDLGRFSFKKIFLSNVTRVMISAETKNGTRNAQIRLDPELKMDTIVSVGSMKNTCFDLDLNANFNRQNSFRRMKEMGFNPEKGTILLEGVDIVKKRVITDDGHFRIYSMPDNSLTVTPDDYQYQNVLDYLEGKVGGLQISGDNISIRGGGMPLFLIDGMEISGFGQGNAGIVQEIRNLRMNDIDKVEVLKSGGNMAIFGSKGGNGVISIFRKTTSESSGHSNNYENGRIETSIRGFHKAQKFYSPTYALDNINNPQPDYRPTLLWEPALDIKSGKANISFFTSDELAYYVVFVEGISKNGKICFGTTSFLVDKK